MNSADLIVILFIAAAVIPAARYLVRRRGCSCGDSGCSCCAHRENCSFQNHSGK